MFIMYITIWCEVLSPSFYRQVFLYVPLLSSSLLHVMSEVLWRFFIEFNTHGLFCTREQRQPTLLISTPSHCREAEMREHLEGAVPQDGLPWRRNKKWWHLCVLQVDCDISALCQQQSRRLWPWIWHVLRRRVCWCTSAGTSWIVCVVSRSTRCLHRFTEYTHRLRPNHCKLAVENVRIILAIGSFTRWM